MADRVGQQPGNYRLVALVGQGGYAQVYLGQHVRLEMQAAIKVMHTHLTEQESEHFQQEAQTIAGSPILRWSASWILMCRTASLSGDGACSGWPLNSLTSSLMGCARYSWRL